jgi:hypothetical protein
MATLPLPLVYVKAITWEGQLLAYCPVGAIHRVMGWGYPALWSTIK